MRFFWLGQALWFLLVENRVSCLASSSSPSVNAGNRLDKIRVISKNQNGGNIQIWENDIPTTTTSTSRRPRRAVRGDPILATLRSALRSTFLPSGYPQSVPPFYLQYAIWSGIQDLSTQLRGVLATQRVLEGVGVGREGATALSALLNFLVRDGCGMAATLLFTASSASRFQTDIKRWRLFADIMVDIGITLEVAAAQMPRTFFLPMICAGNMCKAMCGVAAGAVGGGINLYWAEGTHISDISAKFGAQNTVTASIGLIFAAILAKSIANVHPAKIWTMYSALTAIHVWANVRLMRLISFKTFNAPRLRIIFQQFWNQYCNKNDGENIRLPTPTQIALREPLFFLSLRSTLRTAKIRFGVPFNDVTEKSHKILESKEILKELEKPYWLSDVHESKGRLWFRRPTIKVALNTNSTSRQVIQAYFSALALAFASKSSSVGIEDLDNLWTLFSNACEQAGWNLDQNSIASQGYRVHVDQQSPL